MQFTLNGTLHTLDIAEVERRLDGVAPEPVRQHGVRVNGVVYPVKQAFEIATGVARSEFTSHVARRHLAALGLELIGFIDHRTGVEHPPGDPLAVDEQHRPGAPETTRGADEAWHSEAVVQAAVVAHLVAAGWRILSVADTASRQHGVDVVAARVGGDGVGIEVKGYPSRHYADPRRAGEQKRTQPSTQAGHWYAQAVLAAMRLRSKRPELLCVIALPDFSRYRDLFTETHGSLRAAGIEVWWVDSAGQVST